MRLAPPKPNSVALISALLVGAIAGCISVQGKRLDTPYVAPALANYCTQYASAFTQVQADPGAVYGSFRTLLNNAAGEILAGAYNLVNGANLGLLRLPLTSAMNWLAIDTLAPAGAVAGLAIVDSLRDSAGRLYTAGNNFDAGLAPVEAWVRVSLDDGATWNYVSAPEAGVSSVAISADSTGNLYWSQTSGSSPGLSAVLRRSVDHGATWTTVVTNQLVGGQDTTFGAVVTLPSGNLVWFGSAIDGVSQSHGLTWISLDGGVSWGSRGDFHPGTLLNAAFQSGRVATDGSLWVTANADTTFATDTRWQVLRSTDEGLSFTAIDDYLYSPGRGAGTAFAGKMFQDASHRILVPGYAADAAGHKHGLLRVTADSGATWTTLFDYADPANGDASFYAAGLDANLNLFVSGNSNGPTGAVFRLDCQSRVLPTL